MKKIMIFLVAISFGLFLTSCNNNSETVTLTVYSQTTNTSGKMTGWFAQVIKEKFNAEINIIPDTEGTYATRMESGDLGDIVVWGGDGQQYQDAFEQGMLFDWENDNLVQDYGPYIWENMKDALNKNKSISDGTVYGYGHDVALSNEDIGSFFYTWDIRWDLYNQLGQPEIKNLDDYYNLLVEMKKIEPLDERGNPTYAFSLWPDWDGNMVMYMKAFVTAFYGLDELGMGHYDPLTGKYIGALDEDSKYIEVLEFFNKLYRADLIDPNSMTQTFDEMITKVTNGGVFASIFNYAGSLAYNSDKHLEEGKIMLSLIPEDAVSLAYGLSTMGSTIIWSIGSQSQFPEKSMEIINWLSTPEGRLTMEYGPKGENWYYKDGSTHFTDQGLAMRNDPFQLYGEDSKYSGSFQDGRYDLGASTWAIDSSNPETDNETYNWEFWESNRGAPRNNIEAVWRESTGFEHHQNYLGSKNYNLVVASLYKEGRQTPELKVVWEQVSKTIRDNSWNAIYAKNDGEFNLHIRNMRNQANSYGYKDTSDWSSNEASVRWEAEQKALGK